MPGYWMNETSGVLRPAIEAYLSGCEMTIEQIVAMRAYLRQWINGDWAPGPELACLRREVEMLCTQGEIGRWIDVATNLGIDPL